MFAKSIVLDETDALFLDESFRLDSIGTTAPPTTQFIFVTATLPKRVEEQVRKEFPSVVKITGPGLHRTAPLTEAHLVDCSAPDYGTGDIGCLAYLAHVTLRCPARSYL